MVVEALKTLNHVGFFQKGWIENSTVFHHLRYEGIKRLC